MDFFAQQEVAHRRTVLLVFWFCVAVVLIIAGIYLAVMFAFFRAGLAPSAGATGLATLWNPSVLLGVASLTSLLIAAGSLFKIAELRGGGGRVAGSLGGIPISPDTTDFRERRLLNVVEEMAIASGVPCPPVYVLENEQAINAFAAGYKPDDAVIGMTRGSLTALKRDELQGVVAHEFSHILNGDMRLNIRLIGVLHGILLLGLIGRAIVRSVGRGGSRRGKNKGGGIVLFGVALMVIGFAGVFCGRLIKSAVSRQREFLADASAVQFTRLPSGIAGALKKIGGLSAGARLGHPKAEEASHMFFGNALKASWLGMLSTHPPLAARVTRLEPDFDGVFPRLTMEELERETGLAEPAAAGPPAPTAATPFPFLGRLGAPLLAALAASPERVLEIIGAPATEHLEAARSVLDSLPADVRGAVREPFGARAVVYALLLDEVDEARGQQLARLRETADPAVVAETERLHPAVRAIRREARLPLAGLSLPALRRLSPEQHAAFKSGVRLLVEADERVGVFEFALSRLLVRHLDAAFEQPRRKEVRVRSPRQAAAEISCLLSRLAWTGQQDAGGAERAFERAVADFHEPPYRFVFLPAERCGLDVVDRALDTLSLASPGLKRKLVVAAFRCLVDDGRIDVREAELFRAVAEALDCPVPPWPTEQAEPPEQA